VLECLEDRKQVGVEKDSIKVMIKLKLRGGTETTHGRNVTRFMSHCDEVDEGRKRDRDCRPMKYIGNAGL
jgi:hypothetical protein